MLTGAVTDFEMRTGVGKSLDVTAELAGVISTGVDGTGGFDVFAGEIVKAAVGIFVSMGMTGGSERGIWGKLFGVVAGDLDSVGEAESAAAGGGKEDIGNGDIEIEGAVDGNDIILVVLIIHDSFDGVVVITHGEKEGEHLDGFLEGRRRDGVRAEEDAGIGELTTVVGIDDDGAEVGRSSFVDGEGAGVKLDRELDTPALEPLGSD